MEKKQAGHSGEDPLGVAVKKLANRVKRQYSRHRVRWDCKNQPMELSLCGSDPVLTRNFGLTVRKLRAILPRYLVNFDAPDGCFKVQVILRKDIKLSRKLETYREPQANMCPA